MSTIKKLASYVIHTKDMNMFYNKVELKETAMQKWYGGQVKTDTKPYTLELFSDSDWASCKVSRRSTSSGLIFLNGCLIHSHSRSQTSVSLSSMEAGILAATSLLTEAIYVKQVLQFLVNDIGGLGSQRCAEMRLRLDPTSAQAFFTRLGPGRAKHLSARLLWTQQAMRRQWFVVDKFSTKENPADLNTKALSKERREFLIKRVGLVCERFEDDEEVPYQGKKRQLVKMLVNMIMATNLRGCDGGPLTWTSSWAPGRWMQIDKDALEHCHCTPLWWSLWWRWWWFEFSTSWLWRWRFWPTTRQHRDRSEKQCNALCYPKKRRISPLWRVGWKPFCRNSWRRRGDEQWRDSFRNRCEVNPSSSSRAEITEADVEAPAMRHRALPLASEKTIFFLKKQKPPRESARQVFRLLGKPLKIASSEDQKLIF